MATKSRKTNVRYTVVAGRQIYRDGAPFISIGREGATSPTEADAMVHTVARFLNKAKRSRR